jgi:hypothetical protein
MKIDKEIRYRKELKEKCILKEKNNRLEILIAKRDYLRKDCIVNE